MKTVSWPVGVNRIVMSEASAEIGTGGIKSDQSENGTEMSRLTGSGVPDLWQVTMYFSNARDAFFRSHGKTEWRAFCDWFKGIAMNGVLPFHFSRIDDPSDTTESAIYRIKSQGLPKGTPFGDQMKVTMTWAEVFTDIIEIPNMVAEADYIDVTNGMIDFRFTEVPAEQPEADDFTVTVSYNGGTRAAQAVHGIDWDGQKSVHLYVDEKSLAGLYTWFVEYDGETVSGSMTVEEDDE